MATPTVSNAFITRYEDEVHITYQRQGAKLPETIRKKPGIVGEKVRFQKITTEAEAEEGARHGDFPTQELTHGYSDATITNWKAGMKVDEDDLEKINIDERQALYKSGAYCIGRKVDSLIIAAADLTSIFTGDYSAPMSLAVILAGLDLLNAASVPDDGDRFGLLSSHAWLEMMCYEQFSHADWVGPNGLAWTQGIKVKDWAGVKWLMHTGLPVASSDNRTCFLYHRSALGLAQNSEIKARIEWDPRADLWLIKHKVGAGACLIDEKGVVELRVDDDTAITTPMDKLIAATEANT